MEQQHLTAHLPKNIELTVDYRNLQGTVAAAAHLGAQLAREFPERSPRDIAYAAANEVIGFQHNAPTARNSLANEGEVELLDFQ